MKKTVVAFISIVFASIVHAETITWIGTESDDWNVVGNWDLERIPAIGDDVVIPAGKTVTLEVSSENLSSIEISGTLVMNDWDASLNASSVTVKKGGILTSGEAVTNDEDLSRVCVKCDTLTIDRDGAIDVNYKGYKGADKGTDSSPYLPGYGPGGSTVVGDETQGPSHGGHGGALYNANVLNPRKMPYDDYKSPSLPGSSGGSSKWAEGQNGGGVVKIEATGSVVVNGAILADGANASAYARIIYDNDGTKSWDSPNLVQDNHDQSGSGGSIYIVCDNFSGSGTLSAKGGGGCFPLASRPSYSAGGGMIAVHYSVESQKAVSVEGMTITAQCGLYERYLHNTITDERTSYKTTNVDEKDEPKEVSAGMGTVYFTDEQIALQIAGKSLTGNILGVTNIVYDSDWNFTAGRVKFGEEGVKVTVNGDLTLSGEDSRLEIGGGMTTNWDSRVVMYAGTNVNYLTVTGDLKLEGVSRLDIHAAATNGVDRFGSYVKVGGDMTISENCFVYSWSDCENLGSPVFEVGSLNVMEGAVFSAYGRGGRGSYHEKNTSYASVYGGQKNGKGPGSGSTLTGGSHGGMGGGAGTTTVAANTYDDEFRPCMAGSGGSSYGNAWAISGAGGGLIYVSATNGVIRVDGTIDASGRHGSILGNGYGGGGSGGTIFLEAKTFLGGETGQLIANGGDTKPSVSGATSLRSGSGGGGRIAVWCGRPWGEGLSDKKVVKSTSPITDFPKSMNYEGSYSVAPGEAFGEYAEERNQGYEGTVYFCYGRLPEGIVLYIK